MNIIALNGSPRLNGNTEIMVNAFLRGAQDSGHNVKKINLAKKQILGCLGCHYCSVHNGECLQKDDMGPILRSLDQADMVAFASPIYWFDITGQLKCAIDRMYARGRTGFHFHMTALLLNSAAENVYAAAITQYQAMTTYLHWINQGIITISGMVNKGDMSNAPGLESAYNLGKSLSAD